MRIALIVASVAIVAGSAVSIVIQRQSAAELRQYESQIAAQSDELSRFATENDKLAALVNASTNSPRLSSERLAELIKLRNETYLLRRTNAELARLERVNNKLRAAAAEASAGLEAARSLPNYWPKEQLAFSGFADPVSAMKSILSAMRDGDPSAMRTYCTPEALSKLEKEWKNEDIPQDERDAQLKSMATAFVSNAAGFHIVDTTQPSPNVTIANVSFDGTGKQRKFILKQVGSEWKFDDLAFGGGSASGNARQSQQ